MNGNVIQKGEKKPTKVYYLTWLISIAISIMLIIKKYYKKIDWIIVIPFLWIALISSYLWQTLHNYYPADIERGVSGWMFYGDLLLTKKLFFGGVFEDIILFHPLGLLFGCLLALYVFKIFNPTKRKQELAKWLFYLPLVIYISIICFTIDYSSRVSFFIFVFPSIPLMFISWKYINVFRFLLFFFAMLVFTFIWDFTSVILTEKIFGEHGRCWFYINDGIHSLVYSDNPKNWICGKLPISIDLIYPASGMIFLTNVTAFIKWLKNDRL